MGRPREDGGRPSLSVEDILDRARVAFADRGYTGTNLGDVADALGVTRQAIYYYFPAKHDILVALFDQFFARLESGIDDAIATTGDPVERFAAMYAAHLETVAGSPENSTIFTREDVHLRPEARRELQERRRRYNDRFVAAYKAGISAGRFRNIGPEVAVALLIGSANWTFRWFRPDGDGATRELAATATEFLQSGYLQDD